MLCAYPMLSVATEESRVEYPDGYRFWTHVKSMVIQQGHPLYDAFGGIHHIYANAKALQALQAGTPFPDGAVLVFDLLDLQEEEHALLEGTRKVVGVMYK
ncbi:MAG: cytochrome C, partial [Nitrospinota bacterium]